MSLDDLINRDKSVLEDEEEEDKRFEDFINSATEDFVKTEDEYIIHIAENAEIKRGEITNNLEVHEVKKFNEAHKLKIRGADVIWICKMCGKTSTSYEAMIKSDALSFVDESWSDEVIETVNETVSEAEEMDTKEFVKS